MGPQIAEVASNERTRALGRCRGKSLEELCGCAPVVAGALPWRCRRRGLERGKSLEPMAWSLWLGERQELGERPVPQTP